MKKQTINKSVILFIIFYLLNIFLSCYACKALNPLDIDLIPDNYNVSSGQNFSLTLFLFPNEENLDVNSLTMNINFDKEKLNFKKAILENKNAKLKSTRSDGTISLNYTNKDGTNLELGSQTEIFKLEFHAKVRTEGSTEIISKVDSVYDKNNNQINTNLDLKAISLNILPPDTSNCLLSSLIPSVGTLQPNFNPNIYRYEINVPYSIKDIYLSFSTVDSGVTAKVNRHKLSAAGKSTNITINIYNKKEKSKLIYTITVNRGVKPDKRKTKKINNKIPEYSSDNSNIIDSSNSSDDKSESIETDFASEGEEDTSIDPNSQNQNAIETHLPTDIDSPKNIIRITSSSKNSIINNKLLILCFIITIVFFSYSLYIILHSARNILSESKININHNIYLD